MHYLKLSNLFVYVDVVCLHSVKVNNLLTAVGVRDKCGAQEQWRRLKETWAEISGEKTLAFSCWIKKWGGCRTRSSASVLLPWEAWSWNRPSEWLCWANWSQDTCNLEPRACPEANLLVVWKLARASLLPSLRSTYVRFLSRTIRELELKVGWGKKMIVIRNR